MNEKSTPKLLTGEQLWGTMPTEYLALSPLDGRYSHIAKVFAPYFSEYALVHFRVETEVKWLQWFCTHVHFDDIPENRKAEIATTKLDKLDAVYDDFGATEMARVKEIESRTNHDVKAAELFVAEQLDKFELGNLRSFVHIGCTSEDITNVAHALMVKRGMHGIWIEKATRLIDTLRAMSEELADVPMLAHTHGQPATPTTLGKELAVYVHRLEDVFCRIRNTYAQAKFNGATGTHSALSIAFPHTNWPAVTGAFISDKMGLVYNPLTTQIESHDWMVYLFSQVEHFNNIVRDLDLDCWLYISYGYFRQKVIETEVGSSTMPNKVNPINFENSDGNMVVSNGLCQMFERNLPRSRMQRDLSDSTLLRNIGMVFGHSLKGIEEATKGLSKLYPDRDRLDEDLYDHWEVLSEAIQTMGRKYGISDAYDRLKAHTRGKFVTEDAIKKIIGEFPEFYDSDRELLLSLKPDDYTGYAEKLAKDYN